MRQLKNRDSSLDENNPHIVLNIDDKWENMVQF